MENASLSYKRLDEAQCGWNFQEQFKHRLAVKKNHNSQQEQVIFCDCLTVCNKYQFPDSFYVPLLFLHEL